MRPTVGIDVDDVLYSCNEYALNLANKKYGFEPPVTLDEIHCWEKRHDRSDVVFQYYNDIDFFSSQPVFPGAKEFLLKLQEIADVYITTAVEPKFMSVRIQKLMEDFPFIKKENIIMGFNKSLLHFDFLLDDNPNNILNSNCRYPIIYRRPWNKSLTGGLSVNNLDEALSLIRKLNQLSEQRVLPEGNKLLIFVGPSGSGKSSIMEQLSDVCKLVPSITTRERRNPNSDKGYCFTSMDKFLEIKNDLLEYSYYAGNGYGTRIEDAVPKYGHKMKAMDISGAISAKSKIKNCVTVFVRRKHEDMVRSILERDTSLDEKIKRISSIPYEMENEKFCDYTVSNDGTIEEAVHEIKKLLNC